MSIETLPVVLSWTNGAAAVQRVHDRYESHLTSALWELVERIRCWDRLLAARLDGGVEAAGRDELQRVLLAPETANRFLGRGPHGHGVDDAEMGRFLHRALVAEEARAGRPAHVDDIVWTALGDGQLLPSGEFLSAPSIPGFVPLDFDSPHATTAAAGGPQRAGRAALLVLDEEERRIVLERLTGARDLIQRTSRAVDAFVSQFVKVVVLRRDGLAAASPGSNGQRIGAAVFGQAHMAGVDEIHLAEAVVQEAIHSCLCVQEILEPRALGPAAYQTASRLRSPWTGSPLPVRSFLEECFVRYGLLNFWYLALGVGASDPQRISERMRELLRGFIAAPLLDTASAHAAMSDEAKAAIGQMQEVVGSSFAAVVA